MEAEQIVPDVIDAVPPHQVKVSYKSGVEVRQGNELTPTQVQHQPELDFPADSGSLYTVIMIDPDAPSRKNPTVREVLHWMVVNVPGKDVSKGSVISAYIGSGPPKDSGLHRYIFLVFKQPASLNVDEPGDTSDTALNRRNFKTRAFAKKYNLGNAVAGNFYQAQYDDYVPILHAKLQKNQ